MCRWLWSPKGVVVPKVWVIPTGDNCTIIAHFPISGKLLQGILYKWVCHLKKNVIVLHCVQYCTLAKLESRQRHCMNHDT